MKKLLFAALPVAALLLSFVRPADPLPIGSSLPSPDLKMKDISGRSVSFNDVKKAKGLLVMFSCNTCPVVIGYESRTAEICKYAQEKGLGVILLNPNEALRGDGDSFEDMKEYAKKLGYNWSYVVDENSKMADAFGATRTPECFLFTPAGKLAYHGAIDDNARDPQGVSRKHLKEAIDQMVGGKEISVKTTRSVGCTIKRVK